MLQLISTYLTGSLVFLIYIMIIRKNKTNFLANYWLTLFFITLFFAFFVGNLREFQFYLEYPHMYKALDLGTFAISPNLYLTIRYFTTPLNKINKKDALHFIPTLLYIVLNCKYFFYTDVELINEIIYFPQNAQLFHVLEIVFIFQCLIYFIIGHLKLKKYQKNIILYDTSNLVSLIWLEYFIYGILILLVLWILNSTSIFGSYIFIGYGFCIYYLGYHAINQIETFPYSEENKNNLKILLTEDIVETKKQVLNPSELKSWKIKLIKIMENKKPYLDNEINLIKLSAILNISIKELSYLINEGFGENFNQFINRYRVEESKKLLIDATFKNLNMVGIAFQSGFNSKTIFNTTFKKNTGITPTEYQKNNINSVPNLESEH